MPVVGVHAGPMWPASRRTPKVQFMTLVATKMPFVGRGVIR